MDYSTYYASAHQPYQFTGLPPTPTYFPGGDDGSASPVQDPLDAAAFLSYDAFGRFNPGAGFIPTSVASPPPSNSSHMDLNSAMQLDSASNADSRGRRSSSEEKELTPAQSRRKAQNRAAQRAFRERKERHVKDLEAKLASLETASHSWQSENERLKLALQRANTENEILRATSQSSMPPSPTSGNIPGGGPGDAILGPTSFSPEILYAHLGHHPSASPVSGSLHRTTHSPGGSPLLSAAATWDLIQSHPLVKQGLIDIGDVCERLKGIARCNGEGPVFEESAVWKAVEDSKRSGGDELI